MEFGLSEEQTLLQDSVSKFLSEQVPLDKVREACKSTDDASIWQGLADLGLPGLLINANHGGLDMSTLDAAIIAEVLGYHSCPSPFISTAVIAPTILKESSAGLELLDDIATGKIRIGIGMNEAISLRHSQPLLEKNGTLQGNATFVLDSQADYYLIATQDKSFYLVDANDIGDNFTRKNLSTIDLTRSTCELSFDQTPAKLITTDIHIFEHALNIGRIMFAADSLGASQNMIDKAVAYAKERKQFERVIASFQAVKHMCAEMSAGLEPCRAMLWYAGHAFDHIPAESMLTTCHTKAHISEVSKFVAKTSTEVHGGMGFTDLVGLHYWFKRIGFNRQLLGSPEALREEAALLQGLAA